MNKYLDVMIDLAKKAGKHQLDCLSDKHNIEYKGVINWLPKSTRLSEK